ncbi:MAG: hypothetical protein A3F72_14080 [Bacteroidetes bacterium RIFCSPLOWO2_12_FULL_35_15]|nr:MAG: hypothetical protein A3F72_14080 [Bacteroidetes bacterium RIFCSPLOWO2_12_FULL_35_15]
MSKISRKKILYFSYRSKIKHKKFILKEKKEHNRWVGWLKFLDDARITALKNGNDYTRSSYEKQRHNRTLGQKPSFSSTINYIASIKDAFSDNHKSSIEDGLFEIPEIFSLSENYSDSFPFLKRLFYALYHQSTPIIQFNYANCKRIDIDASVCMDILLSDFIAYYKMCRKKGRSIKIIQIRPINYSAPHIVKILFSIGAFANIKGVTINFPDIIPYPLCRAEISNPKASAIREVHITQMVDYVVKSMAKMERNFTAEAEDNLFKVIGEVLINAEEHSTGNLRYSIGCFQDGKINGEHLGVFYLVILNFGKTIYEKFSDPNCPNKEAVIQMKELSENYTKKGLFTKAAFEEQTLWTLYALQEGVTSKVDWKRGNGSVRFIESFFNLKGDNSKDNFSNLSIVSGNTRITFDGTYRLIDKVKGVNKRKYKMMTFNNTGDIEVKPDNKYVTFAENYFPGTIISAKIIIKELNTETSK